MKSFVNQWRKKLRLKDWNITIEEIPEDEFFNEEALGEVHIDAIHKTADIKILESSHKWWKDGNNKEHTVLHELLHVKFAELSYIAGESKGWELHEERVIEDLTELLLKGGEN